MNYLVTRSIRLSSHMTGLRHLITDRHAAIVWTCSRRTPETNLNLTPKSWLSSDTDFKPSEELAKERYDLRANEDIEKKRARLLYQSRKRGMLENGVILASFADKYLCTFDADHLDQYDKLINLPTNDWDIYYWATKTKPTPSEFETPVLRMLRQHLKSKVSNEEIRGDRVLGKANLDDIVMPAVKKYDLDIDVSRVDLTNYKEELFDNRVKKYKSGIAINAMTDWRKRFFEHRLKRVLSSPTALKHLDEKRNSEVYTQKGPMKDVSRYVAQPNDLITNDYERAMKHHELLQFLLSNELTDDALEYDDEAEAWANLLWHRNYGSIDDKITPSKVYKCVKCHSALHCCDTGLQGYVPKEIFFSIGVNEKLNPNAILCQECKFSSTFDAHLSYQLVSENYVQYLQELSHEPSALFIVLVDLTDFPGSIWEGLVDLISGPRKQIIVVGNKLDLLPYDGSKMLDRVNYAFRKNLERLRPEKKNLCISDTMVLSARTGFGVEGLVSRILERLEANTRNVYLIGNENAGKSTLFSSLLQSDLSAIRTGDLLSRISSYKIPGQNVNLLKFPIDHVEGWDVEMKKRRALRVERDSARCIHALAKLSERRQDSMPHISTLINRLDYERPGSELPLNSGQSREIINETKPCFSDDHPMANMKEEEPLSATKQRFEHNAFFHLTPSATHPDQMHNLLTSDEKLEVFPNETIVPRKYSLRPLQTIFIAGLARLDLLTSQSNVIIMIFASKYLPIHVVQTRKADKFYNQFIGSPHLGAPFGNETRLAAWPGLARAKDDFHIQGVASHVGAADVVFSSFGWALVNLSRDHECVVRAYTPDARGIFLRNPPLLSKANTYSLGKKIRDTPVFENPNYTIRRRPLESMN